MIIETNELIRKSLEPEEIAAVHEILRRHGVPTDQYAVWAHYHPNLIQAIRKAQTPNGQ
jgi:hypothetical protein